MYLLSNVLLPTAAKTMDVAVHFAKNVAAESATKDKVDIVKLQKFASIASQKRTDVLA